MKFSQEDCNKANNQGEFCSWCGHEHESHEEMSASCVECDKQNKFCNLFYDYCMYQEEMDNYWK